MAYGTRARNEVRKNYIFKLLPLTQAAKLAGIKNIATARRWKAEALENGDDWDKLKAAASIASGGRDDLIKTMINDYVVFHQSVMDSLKSPDCALTAKDKVDALASLADAFAKTMKSAGMASPELSNCRLQPKSSSCWATLSETTFRSMPLPLLKFWSRLARS